MLNPDFDPMALLHELSVEVVRLNDRQHHLEQFFKQLANQQAQMADHLAGQQLQISSLLDKLEAFIDEVK